MKASLLTIMLGYLVAFAFISMVFCSKGGELPPEAKHQCLPMYWSWKKQLLKYLSYANGKRLVYQPSLMREAVKVTANLQAPKSGHKDLWIEFKNNESSKLEILYRFRKEYEIKLWKKRKNKVSSKINQLMNKENY
ncbi:unnamed protein product [Cylicocyclus nassatus]|uniref:Uncharacterized protein n=1 Tax=Cylicocyclus nassatus TaxID=53992 RepID=A0AA36DRK5_CYLNA|nr:unnamed protein product [Cylicocyclus nassatus]